MDERIKQVLDELNASKETRKSQYESLSAITQSVLRLETRMGGVEAGLSAAQPTIQEFITIKHKVDGAGALGKWIWVAGAALLGLVAGSREALFHFFSKGT